MCLHDFPVCGGIDAHKTLRQKNYGFFIWTLFYEIGHILGDERETLLDTETTRGPSKIKKKMRRRPITSLRHNCLAIVTLDGFARLTRKKSSDKMQSRLAYRLGRLFMSFAEREQKNTGGDRKSSIISISSIKRIGQLVNSPKY